MFTLTPEEEQGRKPVTKTRHILLATLLLCLFYFNWMCSSDSVRTIHWIPPEAIYIHFSRSCECCVTGLFSMKKSFVNPRRTCAARVTVVGLCVCVCVRVRVRVCVRTCVCLSVHRWYSTDVDMKRRRARSLQRMSRSTYILTFDLVYQTTACAILAQRASMPAVVVTKKSMMKKRLKMRERVSSF